MGKAGNHRDALGRVISYHPIRQTDTREGMALLYCFDGWAVVSHHAREMILYERPLSLPTAQLLCSHNVRILRIYSPYPLMLDSIVYVMRSTAGGPLPSIMTVSRALTGTIPPFLALELRQVSPPLALSTGCLNSCLTGTNVAQKRRRLVSRQGSLGTSRCYLHWQHSRHNRLDQG